MHSAELSEVKHYLHSLNSHKFLFQENSYLWNRTCWLGRLQVVCAYVPFSFPFNQFFFVAVAPVQFDFVFLFLFVLCVGADSP